MPLGSVRALTRLLKVYTSNHHSSPVEARKLEQGLGFRVHHALEVQYIHIYIEREGILA